MGNEHSSGRSTNTVKDYKKKNHNYNGGKWESPPLNTIQQNYTASNISIKRQENKQVNAHEHIVIEHGSVGNSYESVLGRFLTNDITAILLEDPYIRNFHQCQNLLRFIELALKKCRGLKQLQVITSEDPANGNKQRKWLNELIVELQSSANVTLTIQFSSTLHDRQIKLSNGLIIKMGRGLDYFKPPESKFSLGYFDLDWRPCHATTLNVFHEDNVCTKIR